MRRRPASMRLIARIGGLLVLAVALAPLSFLATILLLPLWRWIESDVGIEAVGHFGPAEWCFAAVYALLAALGLAAWWWRPGAR